MDFAKLTPDAVAYRFERYPAQFRLSNHADEIAQLKLEILAGAVRQGLMNAYKNAMNLYENWLGERIENRNRDAVTQALAHVCVRDEAQRESQIETAANEVLRLATHICGEEAPEKGSRVILHAHQTAPPCDVRIYSSGVADLCVAGRLSRSLHISDRSDVLAVALTIAQHMTPLGILA